MPRTNLTLENSNKKLLPFVGREEIFQELIEKTVQLDDESYGVIALHGLGGIGKSRLVSEFRNWLNKRNKTFVHAKIDMRLSESGNVLSSLLQLRHTFGQNYKVQFPSFDIAFATYWGMHNPHIQLSKSELTFLSETEILGDLIAILEEVPVLSVIARIPRVIDKASKATRKWWNKRGNQELKNILGKDDPLEVLEWLPVLWASDLRHWAAENNMKAVIFLDTYEALWEGKEADGRGISPDDWVRDLAGHLKGIQIIISGQRKVDWLEKDSTWKEWLNQYKLKGIDNSHIEKLFHISGIKDDEIIKKVIDQSNGVPIYIEQAIRLFNEIKKDKAAKPTVSDFSMDLQSLVKRFIAFRTENQKAVLFVLSVPNSFDYNLFRDLVIHFGIGYPTTINSFERLSQITTLEKTEDDFYHFHSLIRETLRQIDNKQSQLQVHQYLFDKFNGLLDGIDYGKLTRNDRSSFIEAMYHAKHVLTPDEFYNWFDKRINKFDETLEWEFLLNLLENQYSYFTNSLGIQDEKTLKILSYIGRCQQSGSKYNEALETYDKLIGLHNQSPVNGHLGALRATLELGAVLRKMDRYNEAEKLLNEVQSNCIVTDDDSGLILSDIKNEIGILLHHRGNSQIAQKFLQEALELAINHKKTDSDLSAIMINLSLVLAEEGSFDEGIKYAKRSLKIREVSDGMSQKGTLLTKLMFGRVLCLSDKESEGLILMRETYEQQLNLLGEGAYDTTRSMQEIAYWEDSIGNETKAEDLYQKAFALQKKYRGITHPETIYSMYALAKHLMNKGKWLQAKELYSNIIFESQEIMDSDHPIILDTKSQYAQLLMEYGILLEAEKIFEEVLHGRRKHLGNTNDQTLTSIVFLSKVKSMMGKLEPAKKLLNEALRTRLKAKDFHPQLIMIYNNIGLSHINSNKLNKAKKYLEKSLALSDKEYPLDPTFSLTVKSNLALIYDQQRLIEKAKELYNEVFQIRLKFSGLDDTNTQFALANLCGFYKGNNMVNASQDLLDYLSQNHTLEKTDKDVLIISSYKHSLSNLYYLNGDLSKSVALLEEALRVQSSNNSSLIYDVYHDLLSIYMQLNQFEKVLKLCPEWLGVSEKAYGADSIKCIDPFMMHMNALVAQRKFKEALPISKHILKIHRENPETNKRELIASLLKSVDIYVWNNKIENARELFNEAARLFESENITDNSALIWYNLTKSRVSDLEGNSFEAEMSLKSALGIAEKGKDENACFHLLTYLYQFFLSHKNRETAELYLLKAKKISDESNDPNLEIQFKKIIASKKEN